MVAISRDIEFVAFVAMRRIWRCVRAGVLWSRRPLLLPGIVLSSLLPGALLLLPSPGAAAGSAAFSAFETARREQAALIASAGEDPARWPADQARAVAGRWNAAALEAAGARLSAPLLREQWSLVVGAAAEAWSGLALDLGTGAPSDSLAFLSSQAIALGNDAATILPAVRAVSEGRRAALLLTTSVGCECTMQRAALMEEVWAALAPPATGPASLVAAMGSAAAGDSPAGDPGLLLGRSDFAASPDLPDAFEIDRTPGWLLLEPGGGVVFRVDGGEGVAPVTTLIRRWLGGEDLGR